MPGFPVLVDSRRESWLPDFLCGASRRAKPAADRILVDFGEIKFESDVLSCRLLCWRGQYALA